MIVEIKGLKKSVSKGFNVEVFHENEPFFNFFCWFRCGGRGRVVALSAASAAACWAFFIDAPHPSNTLKH